MGKTSKSQHNNHYQICNLSMVALRGFPNWVGLSISSFNARPTHFFRMFLHPSDITFKLLRESVSYVGYNPPQCFDASYSVTRLKTTKAVIMTQISGITRETGDILRALDSYRMGDSTLSHKIFQLYPADELRRLEECHYETVSRWVFDSLLGACEDRRADAAAIFYRSLSGQPWAAPFRGCLSERQVLKHLDGINTDSNLLIRRLTDSGQVTDSDQVTWTYHGPVQVGLPGNDSHR